MSKIAFIPVLVDEVETYHDLIEGLASGTLGFMLMGSSDFSTADQGRTLVAGTFNLHLLAIGRAHEGQALLRVPPDRRNCGSELPLIDLGPEADLAMETVQRRVLEALERWDLDELEQRINRGEWDGD